MFNVTCDSKIPTLSTPHPFPLLKEFRSSTLLSGAGRPKDRVQVLGIIEEVYIEEIWYHSCRRTEVVGKNWVLCPHRSDGGPDPWHEDVRLKVQWPTLERGPSFWVPVTTGLPRTWSGGRSCLWRFTSRVLGNQITVSDPEMFNSFLYSLSFVRTYTLSSKINERLVHLSLDSKLYFRTEFGTGRVYKV